ncbi:hypothetical protein BDQ94DRAFT_153685 [Aspergillus welwitschiae]|uniref:Uncharacterized protein n=1 Tax=Aspergillus welwitschiae TaxID=1341132 RepID=A0A3F3PL26_9EURO|nr:hypothetical protein BDQ94DRAFT_153685 [Aspergillus welwitschiae]RDH27523.1 hypothetical protein BDQ94DRAFT_153685 [Aspergillus welwitschiae]
MLLRHLSHPCWLVAIDISFWSTWQKSVPTYMLTDLYVVYYFNMGGNIACRLILMK